MNAPWRATTSEFNGVKVGTVVDANGAPVCHGTLTHLIAASPDLLSGCIDALAALNDEYGDCEAGGTCNCLRHRLGAAIAKAVTP